MTIAIPIPMILLSRMPYPSGGRPTQRHYFRCSAYPLSFFPTLIEMQFKSNFFYFINQVDSQMPKYLHHMHLPPEKTPQKVAFIFILNETENFRLR
jgi:hypothetical protein